MPLHRGRGRRHGHHGHRGGHHHGGPHGDHHGGHLGGHGHSRPFHSLFQPRFPDSYDPDFNELLSLFNYGHMGDEDEPSGGSVVPAQPAGQNVPKPDPSHQDVLRVENVNFNVATNVQRHHTDQYDITEGHDPQLVVRRGQEFTIQIDFSRPYNNKEDDLRLVFEIGDNPKVSKGTHVDFILSDKDEPGKWGAKLAKPGKSATITIFTPPDCLVGKWDFKVDVVKKKEKKTSIFRYNHKNPIYMLFNPWCKEDSVYMEKEADREAYVLNDNGKIYSGSFKRISPKPWVFGQFSGKVLDCCMYLLDLSEMRATARGDPICVVRKLTAMVNSQDEGGVLTGNWSGDYSGGKSPLSWTGSTAILEQYYSQKSPVLFGQCWVFSGVLTTVCRALGLPARSVTNFASAHDSDTSITIDLHFDSEGNSLERENEDSVWNFHVWNEAWMSRPDLPAGYGGWQACDATPQETSGGVYCCGPCSVRAIKEGEVNLQYDGPFVFAEVNADKVYWMKQEDGSCQNVYVEKNTVGRKISTLSQTGEREDLTLQYKYPEDSPEERVAVRRANQVGSSRKDVYTEGPKDVEFEICFDSENTFVGDEFEVKLCCSNKSKENRTIFGQTSASTMYYTGVVADQVAKQKIDGIMLKPGETKNISFKVNAETYQDKLKDCCMLSLSAMARVVETKQIFTKKDDTRLRKPHLNIKAPATGKVGQEFEVEVSFTNPFAKTLTDCSLEVEGPGLSTAKTYPQSDVAGKGTFHTTLKLKPAKKGKREITIIFSSRLLDDINGSHVITVQA